MNVHIQPCQSITDYLFYVRDVWSMASCMHSWEFSFSSKICCLLQMLMLIFSIWGPLAILKLDIRLNSLNHFRMSHLFFYPSINTWISLAPAQKFRTYVAVNFENIWKFFCVSMHVYVHVWMAGSLAFLNLMYKSLVSHAQGVYWPVANKWFMAGGRSIVSSGLEMMILPLQFFCLSSAFHFWRTDSWI